MGAGVFGHGMTDREEAVMERHDAQLPPHAIAAELGFAPATVTRIIAGYRTDGAEYAWRHNARVGCDMLERAMKRYYDTRERS